MALSVPAFDLLVQSHSSVPAPLKQPLHLQSQWLEGWGGCINQVVSACTAADPPMKPVGFGHLPLSPLPQSLL